MEMQETACELCVRCVGISVGRGNCGISQPRVTGAPCKVSKTGLLSRTQHKREPPINTRQKCVKQMEIFSQGKYSTLVNMHTTENPHRAHAGSYT